MKSFEDSLQKIKSPNEKRMRELDNAEWLMGWLEVVEDEDFDKIVKIVELILGDKYKR